MYDLKVPIGVTFTSILSGDGVSPVDLVTPFDTDDFTFTAYFKYDTDIDIDLMIEPTSSTDLLLKFPQHIYATLDSERLLSRTFELIIKARTIPTSTTTTTTTTGEPGPDLNAESYLIGTFIISFSPEV